MGQFGTGAYGASTYAMLSVYFRDEQPTVEVPMWATCVLLGKALFA